MILLTVFGICKPAICDNFNGFASHQKRTGISLAKTSSEIVANVAFQRPRSRFDLTNFPLNLTVIGVIQGLEIYPTNHPCFIRLLQRWTINVHTYDEKTSQKSRYDTRRHCSEGLRQAELCLRFHSNRWPFVLIRSLLQVCVPRCVCLRSWKLRANIFRVSKKLIYNDVLALFFNKRSIMYEKLRHIHYIVLRLHVLQRLSECACCSGCPARYGDYCNIGQFCQFCLASHHRGQIINELLPIIYKLFAN